MEVILLVVALIIVISVVQKSKKKSRSSLRRSPSVKLTEEKVLNGEKTARIMLKHQELINKRWAYAEKNESEFPAWYSKEPTNAQLNRLEKEGVLTSSMKKLTRGNLSDIIGLIEKPSREETEVLKFFKIPRAQMPQTIAREHIRQLFLDPDNINKWENRGATPFQKICFAFFDIPIPKKLSVKEAETIIDEKLSEDEAIEELWCSVETIWDDINDPDAKDDYEIKKVSATSFMTTLLRLRNEGKSLADLDTYDFVDELIIDNPNLSR